MTALLLALLACDRAPPPAAGRATAGEATTAEAPTKGAADALAHVVEVQVRGEEGAWDFAVTVRSPDRGCRQHARWWEVVDAGSGELLYRRIFMHSHADEQPFTRSGGPVAARGDQELVVRAWMEPGGYGGQALRGTPAGGFQAASLPDGWGAALATTPPLPEDCAY